MKFIKDIIGEKRGRAQPGGYAPEPGPACPPGPDAMTAFFTDTGSGADEPQPPLRLDDGYLTGGLPEDGPALPEEGAEADGSGAMAAEALEDAGAGALADEAAADPAARTPDEQAIAAFFAREQAQPAEAATAAEPKDEPEDKTEAWVEALAGDADDLEEFQDNAPDTLPDELAGGLGGSADFSRLDRLEAPETDGNGRKPYRIFTRRLKNETGQSAEDGTEEAAAAPAAAERMPEQSPEPGLRPDLDRKEMRRAGALSGLARSAPSAPPQSVAEAPPSVPAAEAVAVSAEDSAEAAAAAPPIDVPAPSIGRGASRAGRVKTRLLGFNPGQAAGNDPFSRKPEDTAPGYTQFPAGWLAIVKGPGRGAAFTLFSGVTVIGRGEDQTVRLDFGDNSISRDNHAAIAYDPEQKSFYIGHGGKANLVRRNGRPVLSTEELSAGDEIRIGETTLRFVPLCGADFGWDQPQQSDAGHAAAR